MTTPQNEESMMIYLLIDGAEPVEIPGVERFELTGESPEAYKKWRNARWGSPLRASARCGGCPVGVGSTLLTSN